MCNLSICNVKLIVLMKQLRIKIIELRIITLHWKIRRLIFLRYLISQLLWYFLVQLYIFHMVITHNVTKPVYIELSIILFPLSLVFFIWTIPPYISFTKIFMNDVKLNNRALWSLNGCSAVMNKRLTIRASVSLSYLFILYVFVELITAVISVLPY